MFKIKHTVFTTIETTFSNRMMAHFMYLCSKHIEILIEKNSAQYLQLK